MQICNYTSPAQDSDCSPGLFHHNTETVCWLDGYRELFHFLRKHFFKYLYACVRLCVSQCFVSFPCLNDSPAGEQSTHTWDEMSQYLPKQKLHLIVE